MISWDILGYPFSSDSESWGTWVQVVRLGFPDGSCNLKLQYRTWRNFNIRVEAFLVASTRWFRNLWQRYQSFKFKFFKLTSKLKKLRYQWLRYRSQTSFMTRISGSAVSASWCAGRAWLGVSLSAKPASGTLRCYDITVWLWYHSMDYDIIANIIPMIS
jgi:hypothetical protein